MYTIYTDKTDCDSRKSYATVFPNAISTYPASPDAHFSPHDLSETELKKIPPSHHRARIYYKGCVHTIQPFPHSHVHRLEACISSVSMNQVALEKDPEMTRPGNVHS
jgi:hypothetical protein